MESTAGSAMHGDCMSTSHVESVASQLASELQALLATSQKKENTPPPVQKATRPPFNKAAVAITRATPTAYPLPGNVEMARGGTVTPKAVQAVATARAPGSAQLTPASPRPKLQVGSNGQLQLG